MPDGMTAGVSRAGYDTMLHTRLAAFNHDRMAPGMPDADWRGAIAEQARMLAEEGEFLEASRRAVSARAATAPSDADDFVRWFKALEQHGPGQNDPLFVWLAEQATLPQMRWFLTQEIAGEAGFDDLAALTQVGMPVSTKLEIARNYWDEMGRGNRKGMHGPMLEKLSHYLGLAPNIEDTVTESLALANTMMGLAANRRYAYHSVGALGAIEQTAPSRAALVARGLKRLGIAAENRHYFDLHAVLDVKHAEAWNAEAIHPLVAADPALARPIAKVR